MPAPDSPNLTHASAEKANSRRRLNSWKEIATFVGRTEGTVQRWEQQEGMPVHRHQHGSRPTVFAFTDEIEQWIRTRDEGVDGRPPAGPVGPERFLGRRGIALAGFLLVAGVAGVWVAGSEPGRSFLTDRSQPNRATLSALPGLQRYPALSPDGEQLAFAWRPPGSDNFDIYTRSIAGGEPQRVTQHPGDEWAPRWSAGSALAFVRNDPDSSRQTIVVRSLKNQVEYTVASTEWRHHDRANPLEYLHDSTVRMRLLNRALPESPSHIEELHIGTDEKKLVADAGAEQFGFLSFATAPNGSGLAVARSIMSHGQPSEIYVREVEGATWRQLTKDYRDTYGLCWAREGQSIIFSSTRQGKAGLWEVGIAPDSRPARLTGPEIEAFHPSCAEDRATGAIRVAYQIRDNQNHLWLKRIDSKSPPTQVTSGVATDIDPAISFDGKEVVFVSLRSGSRQLWSVRSDGSGLKQLTFVSTWVGLPQWSPQRGVVLFRLGNDIASLIPGDPVISGRTHGYKINRGLGWLADGKSIYYISNRSGTYQLWKQPIDQEDRAEQITFVRKSIDRAEWSKDEQRVYFTYEGSPPRLWVIPTKGGAPKLVAQLPKNKWRVRGSSLFYTDPSGDLHRIMRRDLDTGSEEMIHQVVRLNSFDVSEDGRSIVYSACDVERESIGLIDLSPSATKTSVTTSAIGGR